MKLILLLKLKSLSIKKAVAPFIILLLLFSGSVSAQVTTNQSSGLSATYPSLTSAITALNGLRTTAAVVTGSISTTTLLNVSAVTSGTLAVGQQIWGSNVVAGTVITGFLTGTSTASSISGTTLTIGGTVTGTFAVGQTIGGTGVTAGTKITALNTASATASTISGTTLTIGGTVTGTFFVGQTISGTGVTGGTTITALLSGTGGAGSTYSVSNTQTVASTTITCTNTLGGIGIYTVSTSQTVASTAISCTNILGGIGIYTVNISQTASSATINAGVSSINSPVKITMNSGAIETAPVGGYLITNTGTSANTVTIEGFSNSSRNVITAAVPTGNSSTGVISYRTDAIFKISGGDYITIQNFTMNENSSNTTSGSIGTQRMTEFGVALFAASPTDGAQYNTIQNNTITLSNANIQYQNAIGIFSSSVSLYTNNDNATTTSNAGTNSNNKFYSNTISGVQYGIYLVTTPETSTIYETGNEIGGNALNLGNTITYGISNTAVTIGLNLMSTSTISGVYFRNSVGSSTRYNSITSNTALTIASSGVHYSGTAPTAGLTYTSTVSNNTINVTSSGTVKPFGIDFGVGMATGSMIANNNTITISQNTTASNGSAITAINAAYTAADITCNGNTIIINQSTSGVDTAFTGNIYVLDVSSACNNATVNGNSITVNQTTSATTSVGSGIVASPIRGIRATGAVSGNLTIGSTGNGNTITIKQAITGSGVGYSSTIYHIDLSATHGTVNIKDNVLNTGDTSLLTTNIGNGIRHEGIISSALTIDNNTINITRASISGSYRGIYESNTIASGGSKTVTNNSIVITTNGTTLPTGSLTGIWEQGGSAASTKNINNNTVSISGNSGTDYNNGISVGNGTGTINNNSITINSSSHDVNGILANLTAAGAFTITGNTLSLTSSGTAPTNMTAISGGGTGPFQIYNNTFTALNFTGIVTTAHTVNGIAVSAGTGNNIYNNHITNISDGAANSTGASTINGVLISGGTSTNVYKNKIQGIATTSTNGVSLINGISITGGTTNTVYNNLIGNLTPSASTNVDGIRGISITSTTVSSTNNIYYNTIAISGSGGGTTFGSSGIYHAASATTSTAALNLINNIITNNCTPSGLGIAVAFRRSGTNLENYASTSNNNLFYGGVLMNDGTNSYTTIGALKTLLSTRDQNSITENPTFQSTTGSSANFLKFDLTTPTQIESGAVNISTYTTDYVGTIRQGNASSTSLGTAPDIGAWELDGTVAVVMNYTSSTTEQLTGNAYVNQNNQAIIRVKIVTTGATNPLTLTSLSLNANGTTDINDINSSTAKIYYTTNTTFSTASLFGGTTPNTTSFDVTGSQELVEGDNYFWLTYDIIAGATQSDLIDGECTSIIISSASQTPTTSAPSGSKTIQSAMSGNYDVGVNQTYATLTAASNDINLRGVSGAVTFTLASDYSSVSETFPITINQYTGVSATNTLTIKPGTGVTAVISGTPSLSNPLLQLLGADYVTIDGSNDGTTSRNLTFTNTGITGLTSGIQLSSASASNGATYNVIKNCKFDAGSYGIISGGLSLSANAIAPLSNNSIVNNEFIKMNYGINIQGYAVTPYDANWVINNNMFGSTTTPANYLIIRAIRIDNASNFLISNNTISGIHNSATNALYGIYMGGAYATGDIKNNTISNIKKNAVDNSGVYGIYSTSSTSNNNISIYNNSISDLIPYGSISSTATTCGGIYFTGAGNSGYKIYNNTISISGTHPVSGTSTTTSHCIYFSSALNVASGFDIRNNIFSNTSTSGNRFSFSSFSLTAIFSTISHNNYFSSGTSLGNSGGTAYTTLTNLMSALSSTVGNLNVLPSFTSTTNLHLTTTGNCSLNNSGTPLGTVTTDMDGDTRSTSTPDIGADEFSGVNNTSSAASANPTLCSNTALTNITHTTTGATGIGSYTGLPSGVSAAWATNTITISGTPSASGVFNYTIPLTVPTTGGCTTVNATGTITVNPNPTALVLTGSSTCPSTTGSITSSTSVSGANYQLYDSSDATLGSSVAGTGSGLSWSSIAIGTGYYAITTNSTTSCISSSSNSVAVSTITDKTWIGPGNWNTPANWSCGSVPTSSNTIIISSGSPQLDTDFTVAGSLTLSGTGSLTINPTQTLTISGTANFAGKSVTIKSDATGTGAIGQITGTLTGATNVTVERYIPAKRAWRALTTPLKGSDASIFSQWQNNGTISSGVGVELWGPAGDATPSSSNSGLAIGPNSSILQYNNTGSGAWSTVANTNSTKLFTTTGNNAFMVFPTGGYGSGLISSNSTPLALDTTLKATGQLITGQVDYFSLPSASHTLIGNPYASPIDIATMLGSNADFNGNVWVWDANAAGVNTVGTYNLFDSGTYTNLTSDTAITSGTQIQSGQAFFVKPLTNLSTFTIQEAHKGSVFSNAVFRNAHSEILRVGLYKQTNNQWSGRDGAMTVFLSDAEANQIANKMANGSENIAFTKNGAQFASNHHLPLVASDVLNVKVWNTTAGSNYKLKINTEQFNTTNLNATLEDAFTNSRTPIALNGTAIEYPFSVTTDVASSGNRFKIVFETNALGISNPNTGGITVIPNPIIGDAFQVNLGTLEMGTYSYSICTALGQEVEKGSINKASQNENYGIRLKNNTAAGMYIIKVTDMDNNVFTAKLIKQ